MKPNEIFIILDPAHGVDTPGKRSPDGVHREYLWSRDICNKLAGRLKELSYSVELTNLMSTEIGLSYRVKAANHMDSKGRPKLLVSLHNNAMGDGSAWMNARGFEIYTSKGQTQSDVFATVLINQLSEDFPSFKRRVNMEDGDPDKEENFTVLMGNYQAVLVEWLFQDNREDVKLLQDPETNNKFINSIIKAIQNYG
jgi:N-acetylmuramoyl-L-alanine amidase